RILMPTSLSPVWWRGEAGVVKGASKRLLRLSEHDAQGVEQHVFHLWRDEGGAGGGFVAAFGIALGGADVGGAVIAIRGDGEVQVGPQGFGGELVFHKGLP